MSIRVGPWACRAPCWSRSPFGSRGWSSAASRSSTSPRCGSAGTSPSFRTPGHAGNAPFALERSKFLVRRSDHPGSSRTGTFKGKSVLSAFFLSRLGSRMNFRLLARCLFGNLFVPSSSGGRWCKWCRSWVAAWRATATSALGTCSRPRTQWAGTYPRSHWSPYEVDGPCSRFGWGSLPNKSTFWSYSTSSFWSSPCRRGAHPGQVARLLAALCISGRDQGSKDRCALYAHCGSSSYHPRFCYHGWRPQIHNFQSWAIWRSYLLHTTELPD